ncbi:hypothetical protein [Sphingobium sp. CAP-1]|uniref:hypothetical protein n=1 Tax=Sphingobium sp. CAP-1 TaxID=2676077 RepID=UPI0012BB2888|nr:hypothetical protein [Sphingobium sp. CAP-1]QGP77587.1 hypothetical protein GL174_00210 [Sphingobium sp. CAP-1]
MLTLKCNINNWFQDVSIETVQSIMAQLPAYDEIITYGSSMGGYAAMYFAQAVGARVCIALSPQFSIEPAVVPFEMRWAGDAARIHFTHQRLSEVIGHGGTTYYVLFDPHTLDGQHVDMMMEISNRVMPIPIPHSGHPSGVVLQEAGLLASTFDNLVRGKIPDLREPLRKNRRQSASYLSALAQRCIDKRRMQTAEGLLAAACKIGNRADIQLSYSRVLLKNLKPQEAHDALEEAWPKLGHDAHLIAYRAHLQHLTGDIDGAFKSFDDAIRKQPDLLAFYQGERAMFGQVVRDFQNEKRLRDAALARAKAELELHHGQTGSFSRPVMIATFSISLVILLILAGVAITFRLV